MRITTEDLKQSCGKNIDSEFLHCKDEKSTIKTNENNNNNAKISQDNNYHNTENSKNAQKTDLKEKVPESQNLFPKEIPETVFLENATSVKQDGDSEKNSNITQQPSNSNLTKFTTKMYDKATTTTNHDTIKNALLTNVHWILPMRDKFGRVVVVLNPHLVYENRFFEFLSF